MNAEIDMRRPNAPARLSNSRRAAMWRNDSGFSPMNWMSVALECFRYPANSSSFIIAMRAQRPNDPSSATRPTRA